MQKRLGIITSILLLFLFFTTSAFAANLEFAMGIDPPTLSGAGAVDVNVILTNNGDQPLEDVSVTTDNGTEVSVGTIAAGQTVEKNVNSYPISEEGLDGSLLWTVQWNEDGEWGNKDYSMPVSRKVGEAKLSLERKLSDSMVAEGSEVKITYTLRNTGDLPIKNIVITDPISGNAIAQGVSLEPGASENFYYTVKVDKVLESKPTAQGNDPNGAAVSASASNAKISPATEGLNIFLSEVEKGTGETGIDVHVINKGSVDLSEITLQDEEGRIIVDSVALEAGAEEHYDFDVPNSADNNKVIVTATYIAKAINNERRTIKSEPLELKPLYVPEDIVLSGTIRINKAELESAGDIEIELTLNNMSPIDLKNIVIREELAGELEKIDSIVQGQTIVNLKINVAESRDLKFMVGYQDAEQRPYDLQLDPVAVKIAQKEVIASPVPVQKSNDNVELLILMALLVLFLVAVLVAAIILIVKRLLSSRKNEDDVEILEMEERIVANNKKNESKMSDVSDKKQKNKEKIDIHTERRRADKATSKRRQKTKRENVVPYNAESEVKLDEKNDIKSNQSDKTNNNVISNKNRRVQKADDKQQSLNDQSAERQRKAKEAAEVAKIARERAEKERKAKIKADQMAKEVKIESVVNKEKQKKADPNFNIQVDNIRESEIYKSKEKDNLHIPLKQQPVDKNKQDNRDLDLFVQEFLDD